MDEKPLYDTRAVLESDGKTIAALCADGFERNIKAVQGVVYLRKHISGPASLGNTDWVSGPPLP